MKKLARNFVVEIDSMDSTEWYEVMKGYEDASIYQSPAYGRARYGAERISRLLLRKNGAAVAAAQCGILEPRIIGRGMAHLRWGPLWRRKNASGDAETFRQVVRGLRNEYACRRGLYLRIYPRIFEGERKECEGILMEEGFWPWEIGYKDKTFVIDLEKGLNEIIDGTDRKWRRHLNHAEQGNLQLEEGTEDRLMEEVIRVYRDMQDQRRAAKSNELVRFRKAQEGLPQEYKMRIILCRKDGESCAAILASAIGNVGLTMFRAVNDRGRKCDAGYLAHWRALQWLKEAGCTGYDMDGITRLRDAEAYKYKVRLCGRENRDSFFLGQFEASTQEGSSFLRSTREQSMRTYRRAGHGGLMRKFA